MAEAYAFITYFYGIYLIPNVSYKEQVEAAKSLFFLKK
jgi:hypothetical protein